MIQLGKKVKTNGTYFSRYNETIEGEVVRVDGANVWVKNQYQTISVIHRICIEN
ncbi:hypothetical protein LC040_13810 [Bacillus tianshenii]|nr:hypothetical protein LC040_13810 [Bacillus tianshenii]